MEDDHIYIANAVALVVDGVALTPAAEQHRLSCKQCPHDAIDAAKELERRKNEDAG